MKKLLFVFIVMLMLAGVTSCTVDNDDKHNQVDPVAESINQNINSFVSTYAADYLKKENEIYTIDYQVLTGLYLLEKSGYNVKVSDFISKEDMQNYVNSLTYETVNQIFVTSIIDKVYGFETQKAKDALIKLESVDQWSLTYAYSALKFYGVNDSLKQEVLSRLTVINPEDYRDADYAGMALAVLSEDEIDKTELFNLIKPNVTVDGITSWGTANACSTSYSIIGLIASGSNLSDYNDAENLTLIENLLDFAKDGKFSWEKGGVIDDSFATPQGFLALVTYKLYNAGAEVVEIF